MRVAQLQTVYERTSSRRQLALSTVGLAFWLVAWVSVARPQTEPDENATDPRFGSSVLVSAGFLNSEADKLAIGYAIHYLLDLNDLVRQRSLNNGAFFVQPELELRGGGEDAFEGLIARISGSFLRFSQTTLDSFVTTDLRFFHTLLFSAGLETDTDINNVNLVAEAGYAPWFHGLLPLRARMATLGLFLQAGYKVDVNDSEELRGFAGKRGDIDESGEAGDSGLLRLKLNAEFNPLFRWETHAEWDGVQLPSRFNLWRDLANGHWYHSLRLTLRVHVKDNVFYDATYESGSGPPNFNDGDQLSSGLTVSF